MANAIAPGFVVVFVQGSLKLSMFPIAAYQIPVMIMKESAMSLAAAKRTPSLTPKVALLTFTAANVTETKNIFNQ